MRITGKKKQPRRRGSMMTGLLAAGAVAGAGRRGGRCAAAGSSRSGPSTTRPRTLEPMRDEVDSIEVRRRRDRAKVDRRVRHVRRGGDDRRGQLGGGRRRQRQHHRPGQAAGVRPTDKVPSVAEGATDVSGRPTDDLTKALGKDTARTNGRR